MLKKYLKEFKTDFYNLLNNLTTKKSEENAQVDLKRKTEFFWLKTHVGSFLEEMF